MPAANQEEIENIDETLCIECKFKIPIGASKCQFCSSYQSKWKNQLKYISSVVGITTASIAVLAYLITTIPKIRSVLFWQDQVDIIEFVALNKLTVSNSSDGAVFVTHISINGDEIPSITWPISTKLLKGEVATKYADFPDMRSAFLEYQTVSDVSDENWQFAKSKASFPTSGFRNNCFVWSFMAESDPFLQMYRENLGQKYKTIPIEAAVHYYSNGSKSMQRDEFKAVAGLLSNPNRDCFTTSVPE